MRNSMFFKKNMAILESKYPDLAAEVRASSKVISKCMVIKSKTGDPNVIVKRDLDHIMLYDNDDPFGYCKTYFEELNINHAPIVVFMGLGLGYHLHLFLRLYGDRWGARKIIIFEEDIELFRLALQFADLEQIISHPDIHLFVGHDPEEAFTQIRKNIITEKGIHNFMRSTKIIPLPAHILLNNEYYLRALNTTKKAFRQMMILAGNDPTDSFVGMDNLLSNLKHIVSNPGIKLLYDKFKGMPAVTVASGPSLNKNIHLLKDIRERALIVCCDASLVPLMKRDIRPHIVVSLERTDGTEYFFEDVRDLEGIYLAICPLVRPRAFDSFKGGKFIVHRTFSHFDWLHQDKGALSIGPAVSNMAFKVSEALGCDPIIMIGQDLAFAEGGDTHVKEMPFGERDEYYHKEVLEVEGNNGRPVKTSRAWEIFRSHHEEDIKSYEGLCINATEGGAKIRGARVMPFKEAIDRYCRDKIHPNSIVSEASSNFYRDIDVQKELKQFLPRIRGTREALESLIKVFKDFHDETRLAQKTTIHPFIYEGAKMDKDALTEIAKKFLELLNSYLKDQDVNDIMLHTLQPHLVWFANRLNFLPEIYPDEDCLRSAQVLMIKEWLGVLGQFFVSTADSLSEAETLVSETLRN